MLKPPGLLRPNGYGLFDILGNGSEWCQNPYQVPYISHAIGEARTVHMALRSSKPDEVKSNVHRGGAVHHPAYLLRSAKRVFDGYYSRPASTFRIVRTMPK